MVRFTRRVLLVAVSVAIIVAFWHASGTDYASAAQMGVLSAANARRNTTAAGSAVNATSGYGERRPLSLPTDELRKAALSQITRSIVAHGPNVTALDSYTGSPPNQMYNGRPSPVFTQDFLAKFLRVDALHYRNLRDQHSAFVEDMHARMNTSFAREQMFYSGDGVVYVGGRGHFNWLVLLSTKHLRHVGSKLPVEVILPTHKDADDGFCELLEDHFNARCVFLDDFLDKKVKGFQLKGLALLVSSFERVLLLDADNIPAHSPDPLFERGPFMDHGLIVWPDYWRRTMHPSYYGIADITLSEERGSFGENDRERNDEIIPLHDLKGGVPNPSSESGQLLLNKKTNWYTTLLSTYYNFHGPDYYYPLFSQGALGQGDKETFLTACVASNESFYQIKRFVIPFGHFNRDGAFRGSAIGQFDPIQDQIHELDKPNTPEPKVLFVHSNTPKLNPLGLMRANELVEQGERKRLYGTGMRRAIGYDMEWSLWDHMRVLICDWGLNLTSWNEVPVTELCEEVKIQCQHLERSAYRNEGL